jgi:hypothetical protein
MGVKGSCHGVEVEMNVTGVPATTGFGAQLKSAAGCARATAAPSGDRIAPTVSTQTVSSSLMRLVNICSTQRRGRCSTCGTTCRSRGCAEEGLWAPGKRVTATASVEASSPSFARRDSGRVRLATNSSAPSTLGRRAGDLRFGLRVAECVRGGQDRRSGRNRSPHRTNGPHPQHFSRGPADTREGAATGSFGDALIAILAARRWRRGAITRTSARSDPDDTGLHAAAAAAQPESVRSEERMRQKRD